MQTVNATTTRDYFEAMHGMKMNRPSPVIATQIANWPAHLAILLTAILTHHAGAAEPSDYLPSGGHHRLHHRALPPGAIWQSPAATMMQQAPYQPVAFSGPEGTEFSLPQQGAYGQSEPHLMAGLMVGAVYRFRITNIPGAAGAELHPTVELIGRTYPPPGLETSYPIPINISETDLRNAMDGRLVTRVIYLEDPQTATPLAQKRTDSRPIDIPLDQDALETADTFGRPIAIVRIGSLAPPRQVELMPQFYFGHPSWAPIFQPETQTVASPSVTSPSVTSP